MAVSFVSVGLESVSYFPCVCLFLRVYPSSLEIFLYLFQSLSLSVYPLFCLLLCLLFREAVASLLGLPASRSREIIFTSGATESNNLAIKGAVGFQKQLETNRQQQQQQQQKGTAAAAGGGPLRKRKNHIITTQIEHKCVLQCCRMLHLEWQQSGGTRGAEVTFLPVSPSGLLSPSVLEAAIRPETLLVSVMHVNNEIGVVQDLETLGKICRERNVLFHTDAAQSFGKLPIDVERMHIDLLSLSGHKIYGPKGIGALFVRARNPKVRLLPIIDGGGQERGLRSGERDR